jgi:hypothetical protein
VVVVVVVVVVLFSCFVFWFWRSLTPHLQDRSSGRPEKMTFGEMTVVRSRQNPKDRSHARRKRWFGEGDGR